LLAIFLYIDNMKMKRIFEVRQISHDTGQVTDFVQTGWWYWFTSALMGMHLPTWQMTLAWSAAAGLVLNRRRQRPNWRSHRPERRLATDLLPSTDHACGTVYRHPFETRHWHSLFSTTDSRPISLNSRCGVCDFEQTPSNVLTNYPVRSAILATAGFLVVARSACFLSHVHVLRLCNAFV